MVFGGLGFGCLCRRECIEVSKYIIDRVFPTILHHHAGQHTTHPMKCLRLGHCVHHVVAQTHRLDCLVDAEEHVVPLWITHA
jgi:hypothetical protein